MAHPATAQVLAREDIQRAFLDAVIDTGSITAAAEAVGIDRRTAYDWCEAEGYRTVAEYESAPPGTFAHAISRAKRLAGEKAAGRIMYHAMNTQGMPGVVAAIATAKRYDPGWNDQVNIRHSGTVTSVQVDLAAMPAADRAALLEIALQHERRKLDHPVPPIEAESPSD